MRPSGETTKPRATTAKCTTCTRAAWGILMQAGDTFQHPTRRVNELWQTDFTYFRVVGWGWYYLSTVLDDYSRYIIAWKLTTSMAADDVKQTLDAAIETTGVNETTVKHRPRLLSDNGPCENNGFALRTEII